MTIELKKALGLDGEIAVIAAKDPQLVVFTTPRRVSCETYEKMIQTWTLLTMGTPLEDVKALILSDGMEMSIVDQVDVHNEQQTTD